MNVEEAIRLKQRYEISRQNLCRRKLSMLS